MIEIDLFIILRCLFYIALRPQSRFLQQNIYFWNKLSLFGMNLSVADTSLQWTLFRGPDGARYKEVSLYFRGPDDARYKEFLLYFRKYMSSFRNAQSDSQYIYFICLTGEIFFSPFTFKKACSSWLPNSRQLLQALFLYSSAKSFQKLIRFKKLQVLLHFLHNFIIHIFLYKNIKIQGLGSVMLRVTQNIA